MIVWAVSRAILFTTFAGDSAATDRPKIGNCGFSKDLYNLSCCGSGVWSTDRSLSGREQTPVRGDDPWRSPKHQAFSGRSTVERLAWLIGQLNRGLRSGPLPQR